MMVIRCRKNEAFSFKGINHLQEVVYDSFDFPMFIMIISIFADNVDFIKQNDPDPTFYKIKNLPEICSRLTEVG